MKGSRVFGRAAGETRMGTSVRVRRTVGGAQRTDMDVKFAGGGPPGLMLALPLARQGTRVVLLEKHADFLRDFGGDTVHPSTMDPLG